MTTHATPPTPRTRTFPGAKDGDVRLWPAGISFKRAVHLRHAEHRGADIEVWRCALDDFLGVEITYLAGLVWPKVWHKGNPALCVMALQAPGRPETPDALLARVRADLDNAALGGLDAAVADADLVIDAREPDGRGN
jgi:hypothetical protein